MGLLRQFPRGILRVCYGRTRNDCMVLRFGRGSSGYDDEPVFHYITGAMIW